MSDVTVLFIFANGCPSCKVFKSDTGTYRDVVSSYHRQGVEVKEFTASDTRSRLVNVPDFVNNIIKWYPMVILINKELYKRIDNFAYEELIRTITVFNGIVDPTARNHITIAPNDKRKYKSSVASDYNRFLSDYLRSPEYERGKKLLESSQVPTNPPVNPPVEHPTNSSMSPLPRIVPSGTVKEAGAQHIVVNEQSLAGPDMPCRRIRVIQKYP